MRHNAPLHIRLLAAYPLTCLCIWLCVPLACAAIMVLKTGIELDEPEVGWRMRSHEAAESLDALVLATQLSGDEAPDTVPEPRGNPTTDSLEIESRRSLGETDPLERSQKLGYLEVLFFEPGGNALSAVNLRRAFRLERWLMVTMADFCRLHAAAPADCLAPHSALRLFTRADGAFLCEPSLNLSEAEACVQRRYDSVRTMGDAVATLLEVRDPLELLADRLLHTRRHNGVYIMHDILDAVQEIMKSPKVDAHWLSAHWLAHDLEAALLWTAPASALRLSEASTRLIESLDGQSRQALQRVEYALRRARLRFASIDAAEAADMHRITAEGATPVTRALLAGLMGNGSVRADATTSASDEISRMANAIAHGKGTGVANTLMERLFDAFSTTLSYGFGGLSLDFNMSTLRAMGVRSRFQMGHPLHGFNASTGDLSLQKRLLWDRAQGLDAPLQAHAKDGHGWARGSPGTRLEVSWDLSGGYLPWLGHVYLLRDLRLAAGALILAFLCICMHARSLLLGVLGAAQIALSFPLAYYVYKALLGIPLFGPLHVIGIFFVLGIGCDDLFVMNDAWVQSLHMAPPAALHSTETRLHWAYTRASKAMLVTTLTNVGAFLSSLVCVIPNLQSFAIFTALLAASNYALVLTLWPCALLLHERLTACRWPSPWRYSRCLLADRMLGARSSPATSTLTPTPTTATTADTPAAADSSGGMPAEGGGSGTAAHSSINIDATRSPQRARRLEQWFAETYVPWLARPWASPALVAILATASILFGRSGLSRARGGTDPRPYRLLHSLTRPIRTPSRHPAQV